MARNDDMERRLLNWARWKLTGGSGVLGFASVNLEAADMPREPYADAPIPTSNIEACETEDAVMKLPSELKATIEVHYLGNQPRRVKLQRLCISERAYDLRIERAHRLMCDHFMARLDRQRVERARVEKLQHGMRPQ